MSTHIKWLLRASLLLVFGLVLLVKKNNMEQDFSLFLPHFSDEAERLVSIQIENNEGLDLNIVEQDGDWFIDNLFPTGGKHAVNFRLLSDFVTALAKAKKIERKTANSIHYSKLGVEEVSHLDSLGTKVTLNSSDAYWTLIIGLVSSSGDGVYMRKSGDDQVWLVDLDISLPYSFVGWLDKRLISLSKNEIVKVSRLDGNQNWSIVNHAKNRFSLENMPQGTQLIYPDILDHWAESILQMEFVDVIEQKINGQPFETPVLALQLSASTGEIIEFDVYQVGSKYWVKFYKQESYSKNLLYEISHFSFQQINRDLKDFTNLSTSLNP